MELFLKSPEMKMMQLLREIGNEQFGWHALHFHLSNLLEEYKSEYQIKIAVNLIHDLLKAYEGGIFLMQDQSIIVMCHKLDKTLQDKLIFQLRYLYMDDPLAYSDSGQENPDFCKAFDLRYHWNEFLELCSRRMAIARQKPFPDHMKEAKPLRSEQGKAYPRMSLEAPAKASPPPPPPLPVGELALDMLYKTNEKIVEAKEFSASSLAMVESDLNHADLHRTIRRQPVCAVTTDMKVRRVFDELYIHIAHLRQMLHSEVDFLSNRWLFKYLTRILDERMLHHISHNPGRYLDVPISINLNVETLLSDWFAEFDAAIKPQAKVAIVIEVPVIDVFADMAAFLMARAEVQKLGYRVCLDGLTARSFTSINREKLGLDLVKVQWDAELLTSADAKQKQDIADAVRLTGSNRIILCRCDNKAAVQYGQGLGISLFQGRYLDGLLNPDSKVVN